MKDSRIQDQPRPRVTLVSTNQAYWLYEGVAYLDAMLTGEGDLPMPVRCLVFKDWQSMQRHLGEEISITRFWGINPGVVARLRDADQLEEIYPDQC